MNEEKVKVAVERYMRAWSAGNVHKMYKYCQVTWKVEHKNKDLEALYKGLHLQDYEILGIQVSGQAAAKVAVQMMINNEEVISCVMVIAETSAYTPDPDGIYGVNPISVLQYKL